ncbi:hypothetical protein BH18ACT2_BH18ACT2_15760 [soil metagenome]
MVHDVDNVDNVDNVRDVGSPVRQVTRHATWLELFFDLVVVVAVARLGVLLHDDHSVGGLSQFFGLLAPIWWIWISFSYFADLFDDDSVLDRLAQLVAMFGTIVLAVSLSGGVADDSRVFAGAMAALLLLLAGLYLDAARRRRPEVRTFCHWYVAGSLAGAVLWAASLAIPTPGRYVVWGVALVANALISGPIAYARVREVPHQESHMPERFGLFTIVVLGEAILAVVNGFQEGDWRAAPIVTAAAGFVIAACVWWIYFDTFDEAAIDRAIESGRGAQVRSFLYGYGHLLLYGAIAAAGVAIELSVERSLEDESADPLLGITLALLVVSFIVISTGTGRAGTPATLAAKVAVVAIGIVVSSTGVHAALATALVAAGWVALVVFERWSVLGRSRPSAPT